MRRRRGREGELPPASAGLIRYFSEETHGPKVSPKAIMIFAVMIIIFEILLRIYNPLST
ncbi:MAG: preprotein translocase subunit Sec61beta [Hadesarchaea archaeon]|nr:preprotein translocase subunit Sec61beta [Hadesarchaea archaeon]